VRDPKKPIPDPIPVSRVKKASDPGLGSASLNLTSKRESENVENLYVCYLRNKHFMFFYSVCSEQQEPIKPIASFVTKRPH
jgi:hypothetical protein